MHREGYVLFATQIPTWKRNFTLTMTTKWCYKRIIVHHCNFVLGMAKDNPKILRDSAEYLEYHKSKAGDNAWEEKQIWAALDGALKSVYIDGEFNVVKNNNSQVSRLRGNAFNIDCRRDEGEYDCIQIILPGVSAIFHTQSALDAAQIAQTRTTRRFLAGRVARSQEKGGCRERISTNT